MYIHRDGEYEPITRTPPPFTKADRIRAMTDKELAEWISALYTKQYHVRGDPNFWLDWLKQEVKDD